MEEFHLQALTELYRILSHHTALIFQLQDAPVASVQTGRVAFWLFALTSALLVDGAF